MGKPKNPSKGPKAPAADRLARQLAGVKTTEPKPRLAFQLSKERHKRARVKKIVIGPNGEINFNENQGIRQLSKKGKAAKKKQVASEEKKEHLKQKKKEIAKFFEKVAEDHIHKIEVNNLSPGKKIRLKKRMVNKIEVTMTDTMDKLKRELERAVCDDNEEPQAKKRKPVALKIPFVCMYPAEVKNHTKKWRAQLEEKKAKMRYMQANLVLDPEVLKAPVNDKRQVFLDHAMSKFNADVSDKKKFKLGLSCSNMWRTADILLVYPVGEFFRVFLLHHGFIGRNIPGLRKYLIPFKHKTLKFEANDNIKMLGEMPKTFGHSAAAFASMMQFCYDQFDFASLVTASRYLGLHKLACSLQYDACLHAVEEHLVRIKLQSHDFLRVQPEVNDVKVERFRSVKIPGADGREVQVTVDCSTGLMIQRGIGFFNIPGITHDTPIIEYVGLYEKDIKDAENARKARIEKAAQDRLQNLAMSTLPGRKESEQFYIDMLVKTHYPSNCSRRYEEIKIKWFKSKIDKLMLEDEYARAYFFGKGVKITNSKLDNEMKRVKNGYKLIRRKARKFNTSATAENAIVLTEALRDATREPVKKAALGTLSRMIEREAYGEDLYFVREHRRRLQGRPGAGKKAKGKQDEPPTVKDHHKSDIEKSLAHIVKQKISNIEDLDFKDRNNVKKVTYGTFLKLPYPLISQFERKYKAQGWKLLKRSKSTLGRAMRARRKPAMTLGGGDNNANAAPPADGDVGGGADDVVLGMGLDHILELH